MIIKSKIRNYEVVFDTDLELLEDFFIIDKKVYDLHFEKLSGINRDKIYLVDALEKEKSYKNCEKHIKSLITLGLKRGHTLAAIGGGVIQDLSGFISSIIYRGIDWNFYPTTLLAQCDSCIGGKTSINLGDFKNTIGNFNPPSKVFLNQDFFTTLTNKEVQSGLGEILKVMIIDKKNRIKNSDFVKCVEKSKVSKNILNSALEIKKEIIEIDEFDKGLRNIMNYGHTFGHAIESVTDFRVPHGIAVGVGIHIANNLSVDEAREGENIIFAAQESVNVFIKNNKKYVDIFLQNFKIDEYLSRLSKDKKNTQDDKLTCILLDYSGNPFKTQINNIELKNSLIKNIKTWFR